MADFDALPRRVRQAMANADYSFPVSLAPRLLRRGFSVGRIVAAIAAADRRLTRQGGAA